MDQGVRVVLSIGIVTVGGLLALLFRQPAARVPLPEMQKSLVLRGVIAPALPEPPPVEPAAERPRPAAPPAPPTPLDPPTRASLDVYEPPPLLAHSYPEAPPSTSARWSTSIGFGPLGFAYEAQASRTHTIVDGDTLAALALRYLGNADRAPELYEANRNLLPGPDVLPIGVELRIPSNRGGSQPGQPRLVPVRPRPVKR